MKITDLNAQVLKLMRKENRQVKEPSFPADKKKTGDYLEISFKDKKVESLVTRALSSPQESDRIKSIKERIAGGEYELDSKKLAEKMLTKD